MTLRMGNLKGQKPRNFKTKKEHHRHTARSDLELIERAELVSSARGLLQKPNFLPENIQKQNELGDDLLNWCFAKERTSIDEFFHEKKISPMRFYRACEGNDYLFQCLDIALAKIGTTLSEALKDNHLYLMSLHKQYSSLHREEARLKRESDKDTQVTKIFVEEKIGIPVFTKKGNDGK